MHQQASVAVVISACVALLHTGLQLWHIPPLPRGVLHALTCRAAADAKTLPGITQPFPNIFDPLNFLGSAGSSNNPIRDVRRWRESELTHGRVTMLAALGIVAQEQLIDIPNRPFPFVKGTSLRMQHQPLVLLCTAVDVKAV